MRLADKETRPIIKMDYANVTIAIDLYSADLHSISDAALYKAIMEFTRIDRPLEERPREGYLLDFKADISDRFLRSVAAFANTFGGLLIVGLSESDGRPDKMEGIATAGELKTQISSMIASNLFPCPPFQIAECTLPGDSAGKKLCVLRVRETDDICLLARKGEKNPIYVRVEDQSSPVDAPTMRALLSRKRQAENFAQDLEARIKLLKGSLYVCNYRANDRGIRSSNYFQIVLSPRFGHVIRLDLGVEKEFGLSIDRVNPGLDDLTKINAAKVDHLRGRDWYEVRFREHDHDYERRWRLTSQSEIGFITQVKWPIAGKGDYWSIYDAAADLTRIAALARQFWGSAGYFGGFRLEADLNINGLSFDVGAGGGINPYFYARFSSIASFPLDRTALHLVGDQSTRQENPAAQLDLDYPALSQSLPEILAVVINDLLRSLGHTCHLQRLEASTRSLIQQLNPASPIP